MSALAVDEYGPTEVVFMIKITRTADAAFHCRSSAKSRDTQLDLSSSLQKDRSIKVLLTLSTFRTTARSMQSFASSKFLCSQTQKQVRGSDNPNCLACHISTPKPETFLDGKPFAVAGLCTLVVVKRLYFTESSRCLDRIHPLCTVLPVEPNYRSQRLTP
jgi:hypothetical protein